MEAERGSEHQTDFFKALSIGDIFGAFPIPPTVHLPLPPGSYTKLVYGDDATKAAEELRVLTSYGLQSYSSLCSEGYMTPGSNREMTWWAPLQDERAIMLGLADALKGDKEKATILDVACGSGFIGKLLGVRRDIVAVGIDVDEEWQKMVPVVGSNITMLSGNIWDYIQRFGPRYPLLVTDQVTGNLEKLRNYLDKLGRPELYDESDFSVETEQKIEIADRQARLAVQSMQELVRQRSVDSDVDLAVCSFMEKDVELTVPIRDGIYPKGIVYIRQRGGNTGCDVPRDDYHKSLIPQYCFASFDPGENYVLAASWPTFDKNNWDTSQYRGFPIRSLGAEVLVHVRKDLMLQGFRLIETQQYSWEVSMRNIMLHHSLLGDYSKGIEVAAQTLLS